MPVVQVFEYSDTVAEGKVIRTVPPPGDKVFGGETITEYVSLGPDTAVAAEDITVNLAVFLGGRSSMRRSRRY